MHGWLKSIVWHFIWVIKQYRTKSNVSNRTEMTWSIVMACVDLLDQHCVHNYSIIFGISRGKQSYEKCASVFIPHNNNSNLQRIFISSIAMYFAVSTNIIRLWIAPGYLCSSIIVEKFQLLFSLENDKKHSRFLNGDGLGRSINSSLQPIYIASALLLRLWLVFQHFAH